MINKIIRSTSHEMVRFSEIVRISLLVLNWKFFEGLLFSEPIETGMLFH